ncbi:hypothetical protein Golob_026099 [Gossypium lobatum]|uniref:Uncharacterized protein n=1 Tax=Gossypium lobatum TaxID=34289 RepID=A0A7J8LU24_9ROSI|nr:hypothetical protein [Gossypium lobatum]
MDSGFLVFIDTLESARFLMLNFGAFLKGLSLFNEVVMIV